MAGREHWSSRQAFILAAIGSAIGLGNIWRFPFKCYENGGGAFLVAYLIAMLSAGIPLLILELSIGHRYKAAAPITFSRIKKKFEWIGWWAVLVGFIITTYYAVIMAWGLNYFVNSWTLKWGADTSNFFYNNFLKLTDGPFTIGGIQMTILVALMVAWVLIILSIWKGAKTVSKVVYVTVFLPWLLLIVFVIRGVMLPGSMQGLIYYLQPHFEMLADPGVWISAYSQVFYSLSIGFGIMIAYASFLPRDSDIINSSMIIALSDGATAFIGGFGVFGALGYYANITGQPVADVLKGGPGLTFVTYPEIINHLPFSQIFGILFFVMLLTLAVDSAFSLVEAVAASMRDKFGWGHIKSNFLVGGAAFIIGIIFTTGAGLYWLDIVDKWVETFGITAVVLVESLILGWFYKLNNLREYANIYSEVKIGKWWIFLIKYLVPIVISVLIITETISLIRDGYGDYPLKALLIAGWGIALLLPICAILIANMRKTSIEQESKIIIPKTSFRGNIGYKRLSRYFVTLLILGIILLTILILNNFITRFDNLVTIGIAVYIFLALIGGAVYFTIISIKDSDDRICWSKEAFPADGEE